jgi:hypothetical protein
LNDEIEKNKKLTKELRKKIINQKNWEEILKYVQLRGLPWNLKCQAWISREKKKKRRKENNVNDNLFKNNQHSLAMEEENATRNQITRLKKSFHLRSVVDSFHPLPRIRHASVMF